MVRPRSARQYRCIPSRGTPRGAFPLLSPHAEWSDSGGPGDLPGRRPVGGPGAISGRVYRSVSAGCSQSLRPRASHNWMATAPSTAAPAMASNNANRIMPAPYRRGVTRISSRRPGQQVEFGGGSFRLIRYAVAYPSMQEFPSKTTVCWVPSKVRTSPPSCLASAMPA